MANNTQTIETAIVDALKANATLSTYVDDNVTAIKAREMVTKNKVADEAPCIYVSFSGKEYNNDFTENISYIIVGFDTEANFGAAVVGAYTLEEYIITALREDLTLDGTVVEDLQLIRSDTTDYEIHEYVQVTVQIEFPNVGMDGTQPLRVFIGTCNHSLSEDGVASWTDLEATNIEYTLDDTVLEHPMGDSNVSGGRNLPITNSAIITSIREVNIECDIKAHNLINTQYVLKREKEEDYIKNFTQLDSRLNYALKVVHRVDYDYNRILYLPKVEFSHESPIYFNEKRQRIKLTNVLDTGISAANASHRLGRINYEEVV